MKKHEKTRFLGPQNAKKTGSFSFWAAQPLIFWRPQKNTKKPLFLGGLAGSPLTPHFLTIFDIFHTFLTNFYFFFTQQ